MTTLPCGKFLLAHFSRPSRATDNIIDRYDCLLYPIIAPFPVWCLESSFWSFSTKIAFWQYCQDERLRYIISVFSAWNRASLARRAAPQSVRNLCDAICAFQSVWNRVCLAPILGTNRKSGLMLHKLNLQARRHQRQVTWDICRYA